jgi:hypothetical protein
MCPMGVQNVSNGGPNVSQMGSEMGSKCVILGGVPDGAQMCQNVPKCGPGGPDSGGGPTLGQIRSGNGPFGGGQNGQNVPNRVQNIEKMRPQALWENVQIGPPRDEIWTPPF